jgi:hypothetical protein
LGSIHVTASNSTNLLATPRVRGSLTAVEVRWLASADTPDGPSIGTGGTPVDAFMGALQLFDDVIHELLACLPPDLAKHGE